MTVARSRVILEGDWIWRLANSNGVSEAERRPQLKEWTSVTQGIPSVIHSELMSSKVIGDYRHGMYERDIQWVGQVDWEYQCSFKTPDIKADRIDLIFEGLDTIATVTLNGKEILSSDNQFLSHRVAVTHGLNPTGVANTVTIFFESVQKCGKQREDKYGARTSIMRDPVRNHIRKSGYHWGWDWGPIILTAGPWRPVVLELYNQRIDDIYITTKIASDHASAQMTLAIKTAHDTKDSAVRVRCTDGDGVEVADETLQLSASSVSATIPITSPRLWWPNGQGEQHLYSIQVSLIDVPSQAIIDQQTLRRGLRTIALIQRPLTNEPGTTFLFNVNGRDIFSQGACWIPADNLLPTITRQRYFDWLRLARFGHMNMIRVWGGGIYETDDFFDACDEMGLLVWHDFAFACGDYPVHEEFLDSVRREAEQQVLKWRNRTCLALMCGNNEDFMLNDWTKVEYDVRDMKGPFLDKPFPQREIYLRILPDACAKLCPDVPYWPSSPWGGKDASDPTVGDIHQWGVWHIDQKPYQSYASLSGRFVSEFGMHAFPVERTVLSTYFPNNNKSNNTPSSAPHHHHHHHPQSPFIDCRNKGHGAETRLARYLAENFRYDSNNLSNWIYSTQLLQAEAYDYAFRGFKRKFGGVGQEKCSGALVWQLNDVYPTTSWSVADYYGRAKPGFYVVRRACRGVVVGAERRPGWSRFVDEDHPGKSRVPEFEVWGFNGGGEEREGVLVVRAWEFGEGKWVALKDGGWGEEKVVRLRAGCSTEIGTVGVQEGWREESLIVLGLWVLERGSGEVLARAVSWPEPYRYLFWPRDTKVEVRVVEEEEEEEEEEAARKRAGWEDAVVVRANYPVKGCWLEPVYDGQEELDDAEPLWEDNMIDLMPEEDVVVGVTGLRGRKVKVRFLYDWELPQD